MPGQTPYPRLTTVSWAGIDEADTCAPFSIERIPMQIARFRTAADPRSRVGLVEPDRVLPLREGTSLAEVLHHAQPAQHALALCEPDTAALSPQTVRFLAPVERQEIWGAGVTYERSKVARQEESEAGGDFYDLVYRAERPELFFKALPSRVVGPLEPIRIRQDAHWSVPEPELALVVAPSGALVGYTIGNDVSARDIEGVNPLYLPQAKVYEGSCALGPVITLAHAMPPEKEIQISLRIERAGEAIFNGQTSTSRFQRTFQELVDWLCRELNFPDGVILLTGTGIVPPDEFTLLAGDEVAITIEGIGQLINPVRDGPIR